MRNLLFGLLCSIVLFSATATAQPPQPPLPPPSSGEPIEISNVDVRFSSVYVDVVTHRPSGSSGGRRINMYVYATVRRPDNSTYVHFASLWHTWNCPVGNSAYSTQFGVLRSTLVDDPADTIISIDYEVYALYNDGTGLYMVNDWQFETVN